MPQKYIALALLCLAGTPVHAATIADPVGDWMANYDGPQLADLDVVSLSVNFDSAANNFLLSATMAGPIIAGTPGFYVIGVNTGTGTPGFAGLGLNNVLFNTVFLIQKDGSMTAGGQPIEGASTTINGATFNTIMPLARLPSMVGWTPDQYGFNLWPRGSVPGGPALKQAISDFAPDNAMLRTVGVPEPATWGLMLLGVGAIGAVIRRRRVRFAFA